MKVNYSNLPENECTEIFFRSNFASLISSRLDDLVEFNDGEYEIFIHPTGNPDSITLVCRDVTSGSPRPGTPKHGDYCFERSSFEVYDHDSNDIGVARDLQKLEEFMFRVKNSI